MMNPNGRSNQEEVKEAKKVTSNYQDGTNQVIHSYKTHCNQKRNNIHLTVGKQRM